MLTRERERNFFAKGWQDPTMAPTSSLHVIGVISSRFFIILKWHWEAALWYDTKGASKPVQVDLYSTVQVGASMIWTFLEFWSSLIYILAVNRHPLLYEFVRVGVAIGDAMPRTVGHTQCSKIRWFWQTRPDVDRTETNHFRADRRSGWSWKECNIQLIGTHEQPFESRSRSELEDDSGSRAMQIGENSKVWAFICAFLGGFHLSWLFVGWEWGEIQVGQTWTDLEAVRTDLMPSEGRSLIRTASIEWPHPIKSNQPQALPKSSLTHLNQYFYQLLILVRRFCVCELDQRT